MSKAQENTTKQYINEFTNISTENL